VVGLWALRRGKEAGEEQHLLKLEALVKGCGERSVVSDFPAFHNTQKVLQC